MGKCACGRRFPLAAGLARHEGSCSVAKSAQKALNDRIAAAARMQPNEPDATAQRRRKLPVPQTPLPQVEAPAPTVLERRVPILTARVLESMPAAQDFASFMAGADITPPATPPPPLHPILAPEVVPSTVEEPLAEESSSNMRPVSSSIPDTARWTPPNVFRVYRYYRREPSFVPDAHLEFHSTASVNAEQTTARIAMSIEDAIFPYPNLTTWMFDFEFYVNGDGRSYNSWDSLQKCITREDFIKADLAGQNLEKIRRLVTAGNALAPWLTSETWIKADVVVRVPGHQRETIARKRAAINAAKREMTQMRLEHLSDDEDGEPEPGYPLPVEGLYHQSICDTVRRFFETHPLGKMLHIHGYSLLRVPMSAPAPDKNWRPNLNTDVPVWGEMYTSNRFLRHEEELLVSRENGTHPMAAKCTLPWFIISLMFWSDATQLAAFSDAKAWPIYMFIGNLSKHFRTKPSSRSGIILAYIPSMPKYTKAFISATRDGAPMPAPLKAHLQRELGSAVWGKLLTPEFVEAYLNGMVVKCMGDGLDRRGFLRIVTYSMDYPEKMLMTTTRDQGTFPFPRIALPMAVARWLGTQRDKEGRAAFKRVDSEVQQEAIATARRYIYVDHLSVNTKKVENLLKGHSWTPTINAFSAALLKHGFNYYEMVVVDLMHEFEIGVWKMIFLHLLRIIVAFGGAKALDVLDQLFKLMPAHGKDAIRKMGYDVSDLSRPTARVFKDILLNSIPPFEGRLGPEDNALVMDLLYVLSYFFSLAKLHMQDGVSKEVFDAATAELGVQLRRFEDVLCTKWDDETMETPKEAQKRARNAQARAKKANVACTVSTAAKPKKFNLNTVKVEALGDYPDSIPEGEVLHQMVKARWKRASNYQAVGQMVNIGILVDVFIRQADQLRRLGVEIHDARQQCPPAPSLEELVDATTHHTLSKDKHSFITLPDFYQKHKGDIAIKYFSENLRMFLYRQLAPRPQVEVISERAKNAIAIQDHRLYNPATFSVYYTTYDCLRDRDVINPKYDRRNVMVNTPLREGDRGTHPWRYARVLRVLHAMVALTPHATPRKVEFLWVRWYETDYNHVFGAQVRRLERVRYVPIERQDAFGFIDIGDVIRSIHIKPAVYHGKDTLRVHGPSMAHDTETGDYWYHYIGRFCDPDTAMRFLGIAIGHLHLQAAKIDAIPMPSQEAMGEPPEHLYTGVAGAPPTGGSAAAAVATNAANGDDDEVVYDEQGVRRSGLDSDDDDVVAMNSDSDHGHLPQSGNTNEEWIIEEYS